MSHQAPATSLDSPITIKIAVDGTNRKFRLPLRDLTVNSFESKVSLVFVATSAH